MVPQPLLLTPSRSSRLRDTACPAYIHPAHPDPHSLGQGRAGRELPPAAPPPSGLTSARCPLPAPYTPERLHFVELSQPTPCTPLHRSFGACSVGPLPVRRRRRPPLPPQPPCASSSQRLRAPRHPHAARPRVCMAKNPRHSSMHELMRPQCFIGPSATLSCPPPVGVQACPCHSPLLLPCHALEGVGGGGWGGATLRAGEHALAACQLQLRAERAATRCAVPSATRRAPTGRLQGSRTTTNRHIPPEATSNVLHLQLKMARGEKRGVGTADGRTAGFTTLLAATASLHATERRRNAPKPCNAADHCAVIPPHSRRPSYPRNTALPHPRGPRPANDTPIARRHAPQPAAAQAERRRRRAPRCVRPRALCGGALAAPPRHKGRRRTRGCGAPRGPPQHAHCADRGGGGRAACALLRLLDRGAAVAAAWPGRRALALRDPPRCGVAAAARGGGGGEGSRGRRWRGGV
jgi:hypothetical protein